jgi:hypothetical protein
MGNSTVYNTKVNCSVKKTYLTHTGLVISDKEINTILKNSIQGLAVTGVVKYTVTMGIHTTVNNRMNRSFSSVTLNNYYSMCNEAYKNNNLYHILTPKRRNGSIIYRGWYGAVNFSWHREALV